MPKQAELDAFRQAQKDLSDLKYEVAGMSADKFGQFDLRDQFIKLTNVVATLAEAARRIKREDTR